MTNATFLDKEIAGNGFLDKSLIKRIVRKSTKIINFGNHRNVINLELK